MRKKLGFSSSENNLTSSAGVLTGFSPCHQRQPNRLTPRSTLTSSHPLNLLHLIHLVSARLETVHTNMSQHPINKRYHHRQTHKHGLHVRSGSLVDVNQLSALQTPTVLSSLQTNPVRGAAAEQRRGPESTHTHTQITAETWGETLRRS